MKHPHAEAMRLYAEDAMETETPWERWGCAQVVGLGWRSLNNHPLWETDYLYRRKPQPIKKPYIRIGNRWVPEPMREEPVAGTSYVIACTMLQDSVFETQWRGGSFDKRFLKSGICHRTPEAAEAHLAALQELHAQPATLLTDEEAKS